MLCPLPKQTDDNSSLFWQEGNCFTFRANFSNIFTSISLFREIDSPPQTDIFFIPTAIFLIAEAIVLGQASGADHSLFSNLLHKFWFSNTLHAGFILYINGNSAFNAVGNFYSAAVYVLDSFIVLMEVLTAVGRCHWKIFSFSFHTVFKNTFEGFLEVAVHPDDTEKRCSSGY